MPAVDKKKDKEKKDGPPEKQTGVYIFPNGDKYDGEYVLANGSLERSGNGSHETPGGIRYEGEWSKDKMNGRGKLIHDSGSIYDGDFVNNKFHGLGKYTWPNGSFYEGQFIENRLEGEGQFTDTHGQVWTGTFRNKAAPGLKFKFSLN